MNNYLLFFLCLVFACTSNKTIKVVRNKHAVINLQNNGSKSSSQDESPCDNKLLEFITKVDSMCRVVDFKTKSVVQSNHLDTNKVTLYFKGSRILRMDSFLYGDAGLSTGISSYYFDSDNKLVGTKSEYGNHNPFYWYYDLKANNEKLLALDLNNRCIESKIQKLTKNRMELEIGRSTYLAYLYLRGFSEFEFNTIPISSNSRPVIELYENLFVYSAPDLNSKILIEISPGDKILYLGSKYSSNRERQIWNKVQIGERIGWILDDQSKVSLSSELW